MSGVGSLSRGGAETPEERVRRLLQAARRIADPGDSIGRRARECLPASTGLSAEGVELALTRCLELTPSDPEVRAFCAAVPGAARAHVLLSSNVFTGALRAVALALASSSQVEVRASRREPEMAVLLHTASGGMFRLVDELAPLPGDRVWAFGHDSTLETLRGDLPSGVVLHAYGSGLGVAVVQPTPIASDAVIQSRLLARSIADDVIVFDQRGCLSPRVVLVSGDESATRALARSLADELAERERRIPRGAVSPDEAADQTVYRDTMLYLAGVLAAGRGCVGFDLEGRRLILPPVGRNLHLVRTDDISILAPFADRITAVGVAGPSEVWEQIRAQLPLARLSELGKMQQPRFDGPVDRRADLGGEVL